MLKRIYPINQNKFDEINNDSAYWIGLLYADGNCTCENKIRLYLSSKDEDIIRKFRDWLQTNDRPIKRKIQNGSQVSAFEFRSWRIHNKLKQFELTSRKEQRHRLDIALLQPEIRRQFVRGYFDGDGCFTIDKRGYLYTEITGYMNLLMDIKNILVFDNIISEHHKIVKNGSIFRIRLCASDSIVFGNYIYSDARYYMDRKYNLFKYHAERLNNLMEKGKLSLKRQSASLKDSELDFRPVSNWNIGKRQEFKDRLEFKEPTDIDLIKLDKKTIETK